MKKNKLVFAITVVLVFLPFSGCRTSQTGAVQTVEEYFQAILEKDESLLLSNVCPDYEMDAQLDFNTFAMVETLMENFSCQAVNGSGNSVQVNCQGSILARFGDETRSFDLSKRTYVVTEEDGGWKICGHQDETE